MDILYKDFFSELFPFLNFKEYLNLTHTCKALHKIGKENLQNEDFSYFPPKRGLVIKRSPTKDNKSFISLFGMRYSGQKNNFDKAWAKKTFKENMSGWSSFRSIEQETFQRHSLFGIHFRYDQKRLFDKDTYYLNKIGWYKNGMADYVLYITVKSKRKTVSDDFILRTVRKPNTYQINSNGKLRPPYEGELELFADKVLEDPLIDLFLSKQQKQLLYNDIAVKK